MMARVQSIASTSSENERKDSLTVEQILHPPIVILKWSGMYMEYQGNEFKITRKIAGKLILNAITMLLFVCIIIRNIFGIVSNGDFSDKLMGRIVFTHVFISDTLLFPAFVVITTSNLPRILSRFRSFQNEYGFATDVRKLRNVVKWTFNITLGSILITLSSMIPLTSSRILDESGLIISRLLPYRYRDGYVFDLISVIETFVMNYCTLIIDLELLVVFVFSHIIIKEFERVTRKVNIARDKDDLSARDIRSLRQEHYRVTELLLTANSLMQLTVLLVYMMLLPGICFTVYGIVYSNFGIFDIILLALMLIMQILGMILMTAIGAKINSQAHGALGGLFALSLKNLSSEAQYQLQMFISQLSDQTIGINVCGLFTMDGSTFLMIFGTVVTYTVVVLQIQAGSCNITHVNNCNCTV
ncbi:uncharacterized protein LOC125676693 isoform X2 [Ostrea edulis]|uniref:uncharacterized protein LOC125676693 isoform X2 n=1 Tax=Ostrea edulis TaxID=37623 RepID=UPI0024AEC015|nr:uncharacterized protein LOC125676693 isoform X2 [Ostrea edulis]